MVTASVSSAAERVLRPLLPSTATLPAQRTLARMPSGWLPNRPAPPSQPSPTAPSLSPSSFHHSGFRHLGRTPAAAASHSPSKDVKMELLGMTFTAFKTCAKTANCGDHTERSGLGAYAEGNPR